MMTSLEETAGASSGSKAGESSNGESGHSSPIKSAEATEGGAPENPAGGPDLAAIEEQWGVRILGLTRTAAGHMLDFRYRVIDPKKALPIFSRKEKPYLLDQKSGKSVTVPSSPKVGPLRTSDKPIANRNFFILFGNPGKFIKQGSKVTVAVGEFKVENLTVK